MAIIRELKGLWGVMGTIRAISDPLTRPLKALQEAVTVGLPSWDPPPPAPPLPPDQETVDRMQEVIAMGTVEEKRAYDRVIGQVRKITTGQPREPVREGEGEPAPAQLTPPKEAPREG